MDDNLLIPILLSGLFSAQNSGQSNTASSATSENSLDFKSMLLSSMTGSSTAASGESTSLSLIFMLSMCEQLLSLQVQNDIQTSSNSSSTKNQGGGNLQEVGKPYHINQFDAALQVGGSGANCDCGPTSLVMALHQIGLLVAGETSGSNNGQAVDLARFSMASSTATDGVDANGNRVNAEHNTFTNFNDLARGAAAAGAKSTMITPTAEAIAQALQSGASVIASGTFVGKYPLPWTGDRGSDNQTAPGYATGHIIAIRSYDSATGLFTINDPARNEPHQVTASALNSFMAGNAGAMALRQ
jgi:hypothetical protein